MTRNDQRKSYLRNLIALACVAASVTAAPQAMAEQPPADGSFELTPFVGYLSGGEFEDSAGAKRKIGNATNLGLIFDYAPEYWRAYEFLYTKGSSEIGGPTKSDLDIEYLQFGGIVSYPDAKHVIPYFGLTAGAARLSPKVAGWEDETKLAFSIATGARVPIGEHFGVRLDLRGYVTVLNNDSQIFCEVSNGATCDIRSKGDTLFQYSASLGFLVAF